MITAAGFAAAPSAAQEVVRPLRLEEAVALALERAAERRVAEARRDAAAADARLAASALYPELGLEAGWLRSDDPVAAFGTKLRQRRFSQADFDLPALNDPGPVTDWAAGARISWAGLNPALWARRAAAGRAADAARLSAGRVRQAAAFRARTLYYGTVRADARVRATAASVEAARATVERFRRRVEEGLLTRADLLQAEAELASAEAELTGWERARDEVRLALGLLLGWSADSVPAPADGLAPPDSLPALPAPDVAPTARPDLAALAVRVAAAEAGRRGARLAWLPSVEVFGAWVKHADAPFAADGTEWTVGAGLRWRAFDGFRRPARAAGADAELRAARTEYEFALREARVEVRRADDAVEAAARRVRASDAAARAAVEGRDLMRRRFEEGLAGPADLLDAEARAVEMEARAIDALAEYHMARARLRFALGDPGNGALDAEEESR